MENFNLKKFLIENKLTTNSRMLSEEVADKDIQIGAEYTAMLATDTKGGRTPVKVKVLGRDRNDETKVIVTPLQDVDYKNAESGQMNRFTKGSHYGSESKYLSESEEVVGLDEVAGEDLELKSAAKQIFSVLKKYGLKPQYEADGKQFMSKDYSQSGYGAYIHVNDGIMAVSVYDRGIWQTIQRKQKVNELDMGTVSYPTEEEKKEINQIAGKIYNDIISVLGKDKFEFKNNQQPDKYGNYVIYVRKAAAAQ